MTNLCINLIVCATLFVAALSFSDCVYSSTPPYGRDKQSMVEYLDSAHSILVVSKIGGALPYDDFVSSFLDWNQNIDPIRAKQLWLAHKEETLDEFFIVKSFDKKFTEGNTFFAENRDIAPIEFPYKQTIFLVVFRGIGAHGNTTFYFDECAIINLDKVSADTFQNLSIEDLRENIIENELLRCISLEPIG